MAARVSVTDLETAAEWLGINEGDEGEAEACQRVAAWLRGEAARRLDAAAIRGAAKTAGVPLRVARKLLAKADK